MQKMEPAPWKNKQNSVIPIVTTLNITLVFILIVACLLIIFCRRKTEQLKTEQSAALRNTMTELPLKPPEPVLKSKAKIQVSGSEVDRKTNEDQSRSET